MLKSKTGAMLIEVIVAGIILLLAVGSFTLGYISFKTRIENHQYSYKALNLLRDCLEFGEAMRLTRQFQLKYSYSTQEGKYKVTEGHNLNPNPFNYIGDIKAKGLVPKAYPNDVVITYQANPYSVPETGSLFLTKAQITWKERTPESHQPITRKEELVVIPITTYNDQLNLSLGKFWWEKR